MQRQSKLFDAAPQRNGSSSKVDPRDADRLALFRLMHDAFIDAEHQAGGSADCYYKIGGSVLRLRFAGPALVPAIGRAFAHLAVAPAAAPDLEICVWDSASTHRPLPLLVSSLVRLLKITWLEDRGIRGEILDYNSGRIRAALHGHDNTILSLIDLQERTAVYWVQTGSDIPWYETGAPLRILLYWWFSHHAKQIIHGGAIGTKRGGLLLGGKGGSGKSTTALACLDSALFYAGDDYSLVELSAQPFVHSLYNTAKVKGEADFNRFPWMSSRICNVDRIGPDAEKPMMFLHEHQPDKIISGFPLKAVVLPRFIAGTKKCEVISLAPESAFRAIAHSTITQLAGAGSEALRAMSGIVHRVPCYLVMLGEDLNDVSKIMAQLLERQQ